MDNKCKKKYNIKINSINRNLLKEPNPFNFRINFNKNNENEFCINSKFRDIKKVIVSEVVIPSRIYDNTIGEKLNGLYLHRSDTKKVILAKHNSQYDIFISNNHITIKKAYYSKNLTVTQNLLDNVSCNILMINGSPYVITAINDFEITLDRDLPSGTYDLVLGDTNINFLIEDNIALLNNTITFSKNINYINNIIYNNCYLIIVHNNSFMIGKLNNITDTSVSYDLLYGSLQNGNHSLKLYVIKLNTNLTLDDKCFYLKFKELKQGKETSHNINMNNSLGIFHPTSTSREHTLLTGNCELEFDIRKQFTTLSFELFDESGESLGENYKLLPLNRLQDKYNQVIINMIIEI